MLKKNVITSFKSHLNDVTVDNDATNSDKKSPTQNPHYLIPLKSNSCFMVKNKNKNSMDDFNDQQIDLNKLNLKTNAALPPQPPTSSDFNNKNSSLFFLSSSTASISTSSFDPNNINHNNHNSSSKSQSLSHTSEKLKTIPPSGEAKCKDKERKDSKQIKYGELVVLGYNGSIHAHNSKPNNDYLRSMSSGHNSSCSSSNNSLVATNPSLHSSRRKSKFSVMSRDQANGVKPSTQFDLFSNKPQSEAQSLLNQKPNQHTVTYTMSKKHTVIVQYSQDDDIDMFQIGRSADPAIDFIVLDTISNSSSSSTPTTTGGSVSSSITSSVSSSSGVYSITPVNSLTNPHQQQPQQQQSTISRFSCRITVERRPPYTARIYAAGFDSANRIFLGVINI
jgi:hypothetical protein